MNIFLGNKIEKIVMVGVTSLVFFGGIFFGAPEAHAVKRIYTTGGATTTLSVPAGVTSIQVKSWGAGGGGGDSGSAGERGGGGGGGGFTGGTVTTTPAEGLTVYVGDGGAAGVGTQNGTGGGGLSGVFRSSTGLIIAGAGGGGAGGGDGNNETGGGGGAGGGSTGGTGETPSTGIAIGGGGGTQSGGGTLGTGTAGTDGEAGETDGRYNGGDGGNEPTGGGAGSGGAGGSFYGGAGGSGVAGESGGGGAGGAGYYGGGGGEAGADSATGEAGGGGGGGSNFVSGTATSSIQGSGGSGATGGAAANDTDGDYADPAGDGGAGGNAGDGTAGNDGRVVIIYSSSTVYASGTQATGMNIPSTAQYVGGRFVILPDVSSTITSVTITENGTVDASTGLDNIKLRYDLDANTPYDCDDQIYDVGDTQFGSTDTDGFSAANGTATFTGSILASSTQAVCVYTELDVLSGASGNLEIRIATSSDIVTGGYIEGTFPMDITGTTDLTAATITVSGTCKQWDQTNDCTDTGTVAVAVDGVLQGQTQATVAGTWTISSVPEPGAAGAVVTVFIDGAAAASNRAAAVTKWVSGNITGVVLHEGHLTLGSADNQTISNANISQYDNTSGDADVFFDVDGSSNLTVDANGSFTNERLLVRQGNTYQPDASGAVRIITTQNLQTSSTATLTANGSTFRLGQNWVNNGTFTQGTSTVEFSGATSSINCSSCTFYNLTASSTATLTASTSLTVSNILNASGTLTIASGQTVTVPATFNLTGTINGSGMLTYTSATTFPTTGTLSTPVTFDMTSTDQNIPQRTFSGAVVIENSGASARIATLGTATSQAITFGDLTIQSTGAGGTTVTGATYNPNISLANLVITSSANSKVLTTGAGTWTVSGNYNLSNITSFTASNGNTLTMSGSGTLTSNAEALKNVNLTGTVILAAAAHTINGNLNMAGGSITATGSAVIMSSTSASIVGGGNTLVGLTIDPSSAGTITLNTSDLTVSGTLSVAVNDTLYIDSGRTLTHSGVTLTLPDTATISGSGTLIYKSSTAFPATGNASSTIKFDSTINNQILSARTYGGLVTIDNSGVTAGRTATFGTGASQTLTFSGGLTFLASGASVTSTAAANNPAVNITGDLDASAAGTKTILAGTGTWTVTGNVNLTNTTFTAPVKNTLVMSGSGTLTSNSQTLQNLTLSGTVTLAAATHIVNGNLNMAGGTVTATGSTVTMTSSTAAITGGGQTLNNLTASSTGTITLQTSALTVSSTLSVATGTIFSIGVTSTVQTAVILNGTISGAGRLVYQGSADFPSGGTVSSVLRLDTVNNNQNVPARTYGGDVEINNSGTTAGRTATLAGSATFGNLIILSSGSGGVLLTGASANPDIIVASTTIALGGGSKDLNLGTGTWSVSGNFNLTNVGVFTAPSGNTLSFSGTSMTLTPVGQQFGNFDFSGATTPIISGNATSTGDVTLKSSMTLTGVSLAMTGTGKTLNGAANTIPNLTISGSITATSTDFTVSTALTLGTSGTLTINSGRTVTVAGTLTLPDGGTIAGAGILKYTSATAFPTTGTLSTPVTFDMTSTDQNIPQRTFSGAVVIENSGASARIATLGTATSQTITFGDLTIQSTGAGGTTVTGATYNPNISLANLVITSSANSKVLTTGAGTWTVSGNYNLSNITTFTVSTGNTLVMSGSGTLTSNSQTLQNLTLSGTVTLAAASHIVNGNLNMAGGTVTATGSTVTMTSSTAAITGGGQTLNNLTASSTGTITLETSGLTVGGTLFVATSTTFSISTGLNLTHASTTLTLYGTVSGNGRLIYQSAAVFPLSGTISSVLRFDATNTDQSLAARTYGGQVEAVNTGGTARILTLAAGTYTFGSNLYLYASSTGNLTIDGSTNNATGTISGDLKYLGGGGGSEIITFSSAPWTVVGALDISNGSFTAPAGNFNLGGNYTNTGGTFTSNSGTLTLDGATPQTLAGTMDGGSAFNDLTITNNSGTNPDTSPSIIFTATSTVSTFTAVTASTTVRFQASSTFAFTNINWNGQASTSRVALRSSASPATWFLNANPGGSQTVSYVDAKDSNASVGDTIAAADGTNLNSGGNSNWDFVISAPMVSSTADDVFDFGGATTTVANINIRSGTGSPGGRITSSTDIRVVIPISFPALWDESITSITCAGGNACDKIATTGVTYASSSRIAVVNVLNNFLGSDWVQIAGLKMGSFSAVNASTTILGIRVDGSSDAVSDATDTRSKTIRGTLTIQNHALAQTSNQFANSPSSLTGAVLYQYKVVPAGENMSLTTTTISITQVNGFTSGNITNAKLYMDLNDNGSFDAGEPQLGIDGVTTIANSSGTIVLGGSWSATTTRDIILQADVAGINVGYNMTLALPSANLNATGTVTAVTVPASGTVTSINHARPNVSFGGGSGAGGGAQGGAPPESGGAQGGTPAGGDGEGGTPTGGGVGGGGAGGGGGEAP